MQKALLLYTSLLLSLVSFSQNPAKYNSQADAFYKSGIMKYDLKDYVGAVEDYNKAINIDPNYSQAYKTYYNRGIAKIHKRK